jgi:hypothetical protein
MFAESSSEIIIGQYVKDNEWGITREEIMEWDPEKLFRNTRSITTIVYPEYEKEEYISNHIKYMGVIKEKIVITMEIARKLNKQLEQFTTTKQEYFDDPDDPPIPKIETLQFVECDKYMTYKGLIKFDLDYVIDRTTFARKYWYFNITQKIIDESPEIPMNEYK